MALVIPKKIKIGGSVYQVKLKKNPKVKDKDVHGYISYNEKIIILDSESCANQVANTILHECIHGILDDREQTQTEALVVHLTNGLVALFRENPELKKLL